jgi:hypothetical protein
VLQPSPLKWNLIPIFWEERGGQGKRNRCNETFRGNIGSPGDWNEDSLSLWCSLYGMIILCPIMWSRWSITQLDIVDRAIWLQWGHSIDDNSTVLLDIFSSQHTQKHCKLGTSRLIYALDSSRTTPSVEAIQRWNVIHLSQIPMSRDGVPNQWGHF